MGEEKHFYKDSVKFCKQNFYFIYKPEDNKYISVDMGDTPWTCWDDVQKAANKKAKTGGASPDMFQVYVEKIKEMYLKMMIKFELEGKSPKAALEYVLDILLAKPSAEKLLHEKGVTWPSYNRIWDAISSSELYTNFKQRDVERLEKNLYDLQKEVRRLRALP